MDGSPSGPGCPAVSPRFSRGADLRQLRSLGRLRGGAALLGPAFVAAVAYVDPGNFATNFSAGAVSGYSLAWVIVAANLMAMLVQYLSAKAGVATGKDLPELCRAHLPRAVSRGLWVQAELIAMATDVAEFVGAAIGLNLLFRVPLLARRPDHGRRRVRHPRPAAARLPAVRGGDRRAARPRAARIRLRPGGGAPVRRGHGGRVRAAVRQLRQPAAGRRHHRRHRDAARGLPALGADQGPGVLPGRRRAAGAAAVPAAGRPRRARRRGAGQPRDAVRRRRAVRARRVRRAAGGRITRRRARGPRPAGGRRRGPRVRDRAAGLRPVLVQRGHLRGAGRDAGLHRPDRAAVPAPRA